MMARPHVPTEGIGSGDTVTAAESLSLPSSGSAWSDAVTEAVLVNVEPAVPASTRASSVRVALAPEASKVASVQLPVPVE